MKRKLKWLKAAGIRAIKTVAQTAVATIGTTTAMGEVDWLISWVYFTFSWDIIITYINCWTSRTKRRKRKIGYVFIYLTEKNGLKIDFRVVF